MATDLDKLIFLSKHPIDKIVQNLQTVTVSNDGASSAYYKAKIVTSTASHTYGKATLVRYRWSIDGVNYNSPQTHLLYSYVINVPAVPAVSPPMPGLKAAVSVGVDEDTVYFRTANGYHGDVIQDPPGNGYSYTPSPLTFTIQYVLFERE